MMLEIVACSVALLNGLFAYRNIMVWKIRRRAVFVICENQFIEWAVYDSGPSYGAMVLDLGKWKFEHFYPRLARAAT